MSRLSRKDGQVETFTLNQVAQDLRVSTRTVKRLAKSKEIPTVTSPHKGGFCYLVPANQYFDWKKKNYNKKKTNENLANLEFIKQEKEQWLNWCRNGSISGKPQSEKTIEINSYFFDYYLKRFPRRYNPTPLITLECLRQVLGSIDPKSFSIKSNIYKAIISFAKYLIAKNLLEASFLTEIKSIKPKRLYPPKKLHCSQSEFEKLLVEASKWYNGQSPYDVILSSATIATIGFAGLRASELCNLRLQDVDLINRKLFIYLGKGKKNRVVGICNRLYDHLVKYLDARPKTNKENFFVTYSSKDKEIVPLDKGVLLHKVKRLAKRVGFDINLHGLRRTFATIAANAGKPINIISLALGHADLKTTQGYLMTSQDEVIKEMQGW